MFAITDREVNRYERLPAIRGADGKKEVDCYDICLVKPVKPSGPPPGHTRVGDEAALERNTQKVEADMQRASSLKARSSGGDAAPDTTLDAPPRKKPRLGDSPLPRRRATSPAEKKEERVSPAPTSPALRSASPTSPVPASEQGSQPMSPDWPSTLMVAVAAGTCTLTCADAIRTEPLTEPLTEPPTEALADTISPPARGLAKSRGGATGGRRLRRDRA